MKFEERKPTPPPIGAQEWPDGGIDAQTIPWLKKWLIARGIKQSLTRNKRKAELIEMWMDEYFRLEEEKDDAKEEAEKQAKDKEKAEAIEKSKNAKPISASGSARRVLAKDVIARSPSSTPELLKLYGKFRNLEDEEHTGGGLDYEELLDMLDIRKKVMVDSAPLLENELKKGYFTAGDWKDGKMTNVKKVFIRYVPEPEKTWTSYYPPPGHVNPKRAHFQFYDESGRGIDRLNDYDPRYGEETWDLLAKALDEMYQFRVKKNEESKGQYGRGMVMMMRSGIDNLIGDVRARKRQWVTLKDKNTQLTRAKAYAFMSGKPWPRGTRV